MTDMVERVARALESAFEREGRSFNAGQAETLACAAIEAMREPTEVMKEANGGRDPFTWELMIDAALGENG